MAAVRATQFSCHCALETNGVVERFHRSLKYEHLCQREIDSRVELAEEVAASLSLYNEVRPHETLRQRRPLAVHCAEPQLFPTLTLQYP